MDTRSLLSIVCRDVLFVHWPVDPEYLQSHVPSPLTVDTFDADAWLGVVAVDVPEAQVRSLPVKRSFQQVNLRTYVTESGNPGVYFFSLDANEYLETVVARLAFQLPYYQAETSIARHNNTIEFDSQRTQLRSAPARFRASYSHSPEQEPFYAESGSIEEFLIERRRFFIPAEGRRSRGTPEAISNPEIVRVGEIEHDSWPLQSTTATIHENTLPVAAGLDPPTQEPLFHYSRQVHMTTGPTSTV